MAGDPRDEHVADFVGQTTDPVDSNHEELVTTGYNIKPITYYTPATVQDFLKDHDARFRRARYAKTTMEQYLGMIAPADLASKYLTMYRAHPFHKEVCAGAKHHHWWKGGLEDHLTEMIGIGFDIMDMYPGDFSFTKSDLIIAVFLHDFSKVWTYRYITNDDVAKDKFKDKQVFTYTDGQFNILNEESRIILECGKFGIVPTDQQWSAVIFAEGGFSQAMFDFQGRSTPGNTVFTVNHLATFTSILDQWGAQILGRSIV